MAGDTWFTHPAGRTGRAWTALWTPARHLLPTQQEDNATYMAPHPRPISGWGSQPRCVLRTASNFDRPYLASRPGTRCAGVVPRVARAVFVPALSNLWFASAPFIKDVVAHWDKWKHGVPK